MAVREDALLASQRIEKEIFSATQKQVGRHSRPPIPGDPLGLKPLVSAFSHPDRRMNRGTSLPPKHQWKNAGASDVQLGRAYKNLDSAFASLMLRQSRAAAFSAATSASATAMLPALRADIAEFEKQGFRSIGSRFPDVRFPDVPDNIKRAVSALAATSVVTAALLVSGETSSQSFASAAVDRPVDTAASRSSSATLELPTTAAPVPTTVAPPVTEAPTTTTAPPPPPTTAAPLTWAEPTPGARVSSTFGNRKNPVTHRWALHAGEDFAAKYGAQIHVVADGVVTQAGWESGYGNYTCVKHSSTVTTCYGHQSSIKVKVGQTVTRDQVIGLVGSTGNSTGPHLHFEVRVNGNPVNPSKYL